jgi:tetratricopeptide (TPR) repeat protein
MTFAVLGLIWQWDDVEPEVRAIVQGPPSATPNAVDVARQAEDAYWQGDLDTSIELYSQAAQLEPNNIGVQFEYVRNLVYGSYEGRGFTFRAERALDVAEAAVEQAPTDARAQAAYALALIANDRGEEAATAALTAVELAPDWAEAHAYLALAYIEQNRWRAAQDEAQVAVNLNGMSVDARRSLALSLAFTGEFNIAISQYEQAIQAHPKLDVLFFELALYYTGQENYDAAIQAYQRVLVNDPRNVKAYTRMCETFFRERDDGSAQEACEQAVELDPTYPDAHKQLGMVRYTRRNYEGAIESFQTCVTLMEQQGWPINDHLVECYYLHGLAHHLLADCSKAMPLFETVLSEIDHSDRVQELTLQGMQLCIDSDDTYSGADLPTPAPPTQEPPPPIGIY